MTKDVLVKISGMQFDVQDEAIELTVPGNYYMKNNKHYVLFEEQPEDNGPVTKNIVKFDNTFFEIMKKGGNNSYMRFDKNKKNSTVYQTLVGPIQVGVLTHEFLIEEGEQEIAVKVKYALDINYKFVSECEVDFKVQARSEVVGVKEECEE
ncbi:MAG: DUF1934 domain-containing protein [Lachnospiraceae bacterium]|nr:DUF1934 domain-containing protein [Lachnospiraceae bacterium]